MTRIFGNPEKKDLLAAFNLVADCLRVFGEEAETALQNNGGSERAAAVTIGYFAASTLLRAAGEQVDARSKEKPRTLDETLAYWLKVAEAAGAVDSYDFSVVRGFLVRMVEGVYSHTMKSLSIAAQDNREMWGAMLMASENTRMGREHIPEGLHVCACQARRIAEAALGKGPFTLHWMAVIDPEGEPLEKSLTRLKAEVRDALEGRGGQILDTLLERGAEEKSIGQEIVDGIRQQVGGAASTGNRHVHRTLQGDGSGLPPRLG